MATHTLTRTFKAPVLSSKKDSVLFIEPAVISFDLDFDTGSDKDNMALRKTLDDSFDKLCRYALKWFSNDFSTLFVAITRAREKAQIAGGWGGLGVIIDPSWKVEAEKLVKKFNQRMQTAFKSWSKAVVVRVDKVMEEWNQRNKASASVKVKRVGEVASSLAGLVWGGATIVVNPTAAVSMLSKLNALKNQVYDAATGLETKRANVDKELTILIEFCAVLEKEDEQTWTQWAKKKAMSVSSITANLRTAISQYEMAVIHLASQEKKLGTEIRKLKANTDKEQLELDAEIARLEVLHKQVSDNVVRIRQARDSRKDLIKKYNLKSASEKMRKTLGKSVKAASVDMSKKMSIQQKFIQNVSDVNFEVSFDELTNGLKVRKHAIRLKL